MYIDVQGSREPKAAVFGQGSSAWDPVLATDACSADAQRRLTVCLALSKHPAQLSPLVTCLLCWAVHLFLSHTPVPVQVEHIESQFESGSGTSRQSRGLDLI